jgi:lipopolysaccharide/colanic/teichoic acid biosynthesis glycosyltransferase
MGIEPGADRQELGLARLNGRVIASELRHWYRVRIDPGLRRIFDVGVSLVAGAALSIPLVLIAIAVKLYDGGPVLYRAARVGKGGRLFEVYKFRTMVVRADSIGPGITASGDPRVTPLGRYLRRTKLDELPQLLNVLRGEMSLVGPRPEDPRYVGLYSSVQRQALRVRPGMTSVASLVYRDEAQLLSGPNWERLYCSQVMPAKLALDLDYLARRTLWTDILLISRTITSLFGWNRMPARGASTISQPILRRR